jgi:hypothetical protein
MALGATDKDKFEIFFRIWLLIGKIYEENKFNKHLYLLFTLS